MTGYSDEEHEWVAMPKWVFCVVVAVLAYFIYLYFITIPITVKYPPTISSEELGD
jgi:hypothetical protein